MGLSDLLTMGEKMKLLTIAISAALLCALGCQSTSQSSPVSHKNSILRDGSSYTSAILISARTQEEGIREEYAYLQKHFPGFRQAEVEQVGEEEVVFGHHTDIHDGRFFSVHTLVLSNGKIRSVYFDITSYFGK